MSEESSDYNSSLRSSKPSIMAGSITPAGMTVTIVASTISGYSSSFEAIIEIFLEYAEGLYPLIVKSGAPYLPLFTFIFILV